MSYLKSFPKGGIHPRENKLLTDGIPISNALIPAVAVIPMHQHAGTCAECIVKIGDVLKEGMLIGRSTGMISSIPGIVSGISDIFLPNGIISKAVHVELQGEFDRSGKDIKKKDWQGMSGQEILLKIAEMGIVGLGGATFPTHAKYAVNEAKHVEFLVINGTECEPFLSGDHRLMLEKADEIVEGIEIIRKALSPRCVVIGIEANKQDAVQMMERAIAGRKQDIEVVTLKVKYPQGDEKMLLKSITGKEVPSGKLPFDIGAVVSNVGTVYAVYEAIAYDKPLIERIVTITGSMIRKPANLKVRIGTKIGELIEDCGGFTSPPARIVVGGPLTGFAVFDMETPVTKSTTAIVALSRQDTNSARETTCIQCGKCVRVCPVGLSPTTLYKYIEHLLYDDAKGEGLSDCRECGCCGYVCPSHIPLVQAMKLGKLMHRKKETQWKNASI
jgi:electron transport complex protein RnfC